MFPIFSPHLTFSSPPRSMAAIRSLLHLFFVVLLLSAALPHVVRCQSDADDEANIVEVGDVDATNDAQGFDGPLGPAPGVRTICVFPKNPTRLVTAGEEAEILVGVNNEGESALNVFASRASVHFTFDHRMVIQNLTFQEFYNASVPPSAQATFPYVFSVNKYLQPGTFDLVGVMFYEVDQHPYENIFYNGTIEVVEAGGLLNFEFFFLLALGITLVGLLGFWAFSQLQSFSKKSKKTSKVEVGTATTDANMDEWLQGTAYAQSLKPRKKK